MENKVYYKEFNSLGIADTKQSNGIIHMSTFLSESKIKRRHEFKSKRDFDCVVENIKLITKQKTSNITPFRIDLIISINGGIEKKQYIEYFREIDGSVIGNNVHVKVFQRANVGFQWGGFHDVWLRYKDINCDWYVTIEGDMWFDHDTWFDYCVDKIKNKSHIGFLGQNRRIHISQSSIEKHIPTPFLTEKRLWRNRENNMISVNREQLQHTRGGFYFCKKDFLKRMDKTYGCFTNALGCDYYVDGVLSGEVGFSQKTSMLGYTLYHDENVSFDR